jgi:hypothetical protein
MSGSSDATCPEPTAVEAAGGRLLAFRASRLVPMTDQGGASVLALSSHSRDAKPPALRRPTRSFVRSCARPSSRCCSPTCRRKLRRRLAVRLTCLGCRATWQTRRILTVLNSSKGWMGRAGRMIADTATRGKLTSMATDSGDGGKPRIGGHLCAAQHTEAMGKPLPNPIALLRQSDRHFVAPRPAQCSGAHPNRNALLLVRFDCEVAFFRHWHIEGLVSLQP